MHISAGGHRLEYRIIEPGGKPARRHTFTIMSDRYVDPLYQAAIECTEEAILNALVAAGTMRLIKPEGSEWKAVDHRRLTGEGRRGDI